MTHVSFSSIMREAHLPRDVVTRLASCRRFTLLYEEGSLADSIYYLESGLVKIFKHCAGGRDVVLGLIRPGEVFGEEALLTRGHRCTSAEVVSEASVSVVPREAMLGFCHESPETWRLVADQLLRRAQVLEKKLELFMSRGVEYRILHYLAELAEVLGVPQADGSCAVSFSQVEIAALVGATRETTSSALNELARRGLVVLGRRRLVVAPPKVLRFYATRGPV
ncbi:MAG: Crp/Fnr family transcriptional regulator [Bryobacterales bacterium]|nr:Crp/Fnr family transcriptional regulator [Bryobacterales bacterium]